MTETALIYLLIALTTLRLLFHVLPRLMGSMSKAGRIKLREAIDAVVWAGIVALLLIHFVVRSFYIPSGSMLPTLQINDFILVNELIYEFTEPARGEIVVFHRPQVQEGGDNTDLIKRVVAVEFDTVEVREGQLYINDLPQQESFIKEPMYSDYGPVVIEEGKVFVMGDNRNDSHDSRYSDVGQVPLTKLVGRAEVIFFPLRRIRFFNFPE